MHRVLIAVTSDSYALSVSRRLGPNFDIRSCCDGREVLGLLQQFRPDVLVLHAAIARKDALSILQQLPYKPAVIITIANHLSPRDDRRLLAFGAHHILLAPTVNILCLCLQDALGQMDHGQAQRSVEQLTRLHLHILNFQTHRDGYTQLCKGLPMLCHEPNQPLSKQLYPAIAKAAGSSDWRAVEHSIRQAICAAWEVRDDTVWAKYFPPDGKGKICCPSNKQFLLRLAGMILEDFAH